MKIEGTNGRLRLRWSFEGRRYCLALGKPDTKTNRLQAEHLKLRIEADMEQGQFDHTLASYTPNNAADFKKPVKLTVSKLFDAWLDYKISTGIILRTVRKYQVMQRNIVDFSGNGAAEALNKTDAFAFIAWLREQKLHPETIKRRIETLSACWQWAIAQRILTENPWEGLHKLIRVPQNPPPRPFTAEEVAAILQGFEELYPDFAPLVRFLFATGCRIGEALGLCWEDLSSDLSIWTLSEQLTSKERKPTKTGKTRRVRLPDSIRQILTALQSKKRANGLVFTLNGAAITDGNLFNRWKKVLAHMGVPYRKPYSTRSTFISHCLERGMNPVVIAQITGHDVAVLFKHYAGILHEPITPELF